MKQRDAEGILFHPLQPSILHSVRVPDLCKAGQALALREPVTSESVSWELCVLQDDTSNIQQSPRAETSAETP